MGVENRIKQIWQGIDWGTKLILLAGLFAFVIKCHIIYPIEYVGHADASAYAEMADSLIHGRGLSVDYISFYFLKYNRKITRPEDHWPPLYSFFIAPFFLLLGKTAFAAKLPSVIISCFFFPLVGYFLSKRLSGNKLVGVAAGLNLLFYPIFFRHSLYCLSDITYAFMVCLTVFLAIKGLEDSRYFYPMGICMGLFFYAKGSGLILIPAYILFYLIGRRNLKGQALFTPPLSSEGWRPILSSADRQFLIGIGLGFLTMLPWFIRNTIHFHNPIFTTQQFSAGYIGYLGWEEGTYKLYWGKELPSLFDKFKHASQLKSTTWDFFKQYLWWTFIDLKRKTGNFKAGDYYTYFTGIPAAISLVMAFIASLYRIQANLARRVLKRLELRGPQDREILIHTLRTIHRGIWKILKHWHNKRLHLITLVGLFLLGFLSLCWQPIDRMAFPVSGLIIIAGWVSYYTILRGLLRNFRYSRIVVSGLVIILLAVIAVHSIGKIQRAYENSGYPYRDGAREWIEAGRWIHKNLPGSVTMTRNPWELNFYSEDKSVQIPLAPLKEVIKAAKYYGVTHLIPEKARPSLKPWLSGKVPGLKLVYDKGLKIYKIEYEKIPDNLLEPIQKN